MNDSVRFIHSSDWQLGMTRAFLSDEASARFSQDRISAISKLGALAEEHEAKFIVVAGDVFESNQLSQQTLTRALDALEALPVPIFLLPGNHDPIDGTSIFLTKEFQSTSDHVIVLKDMIPVTVPGLPGIEVVGAPWRTKHPNSDLCEDLIALLEPAIGVIRIGVAHGQVDQLSPDPTRPEVIDLNIVEQAIKDRKLHYVGLGDRHSVTDVGSTGRVWYSGAPVATAFNEVDPNKALLIELDADGACGVESLSVGSWSFIQEQRPMNEPQDLENFEHWLSGLINKECTAIKIGFEGSINLATAGALDALMDSKSDLFASLRCRERTTNLTVVPDELDQDSVSLMGYARDTWDELLFLSHQGNDVAQDALKLMYRMSVKSSDQ